MLEFVLRPQEVHDPLLEVHMMLSQPGAAVKSALARAFPSRDADYRLAAIADGANASRFEVRARDWADGSFLAAVSLSSDAGLTHLVIANRRSADDAGDPMLKSMVREVVERVCRQLFNEHLVTESEVDDLLEAIEPYLD